MSVEEESLADRQENEVEVLKSIFDKDFEVRFDFTLRSSFLVTYGS